MQIAFNGRPTEVAASTIEELLAEMAISGRVAVERNRELIPRRLWAQTPLSAGDAIEVVQMVGGGAAVHGCRC